MECLADNGAMCVMAALKMPHLQSAAGILSPKFDGRIPNDEHYGYQTSRNPTFVIVANTAPLWLQNVNLTVSTGQSLEWKRRRLQLFSSQNGCGAGGLSWKSPRAAFSALAVCGNDSGLWPGRQSMFLLRRSGVDRKLLVHRRSSRR